MKGKRECMDEPLVPHNKKGCVPNSMKIEFGCSLSSGLLLSFL
ncbi:hypothetical protein SD77_4198 [Bacillus badius]|uniref:Ribose 5-phosphate isomerase B n=1 Tax=Bacillus badius TaxID=1455 RepID=A0ABR5AUU7_BACBA|nr:hypothetical protein SD78_0504 [Bacillus badius]KIL78518.1 hypothetical protein SD77_4198 [Bacillus badius]